MASTKPANQASTTGLATISVKPDIRIFYEITPPLQEDHQKPILVLSNSLAATTRLWDDFVAAFTPTYTIIRYDARFHGRSPLSRDADFDYTAGHTIADLADDVIALLDSLQIKNPIEAFIGLSIGAGVGVVLASQYPSRFNRFIIVGTRSHAVPEDAERFKPRIEAMKSPDGVLTQARQSVQRWFDADWIHANPERAEAVVQMVATTPIEGFTASVAALTTMDLRAHSSTIGDRSNGKRLLFVVGERDAALVVEESQWLAEYAGGSQVIIVPEAGHIVNVQQPKRFHEIVRDYLQKGL